MNGATVCVRVVPGRALLTDLLCRVVVKEGFDLVDATPDVEVILLPAVPQPSPSTVAVPTVVVGGDRLVGAALVQAVRGGAVALLSDDVEVDALAAAMRSAAAGEATISSPLVGELCSALRSEGALPGEVISLTGREVDLLTLMEAGQSVKQTARTLGIAIKTVENTQRMLFRKLNVRSRAQAIARTHDLGLLASVSPPSNGRAS